MQDLRCSTLDQMREWQSVKAVGFENLSFYQLQFIITNTTCLTTQLTSVALIYSGPPLIRTPLGRRSVSEVSGFQGLNCGI